MWHISFRLWVENSFVFQDRARVLACLLPTLLLVFKNERKTVNLCAKSISKQYISLSLMRIQKPEEPVLVSSLVIPCKNPPLALKCRILNAAHGCIDLFCPQKSVHVIDPVRDQYFIQPPLCCDYSVHFSKHRLDVLVADACVKMMSHASLTARPNMWFIFQSLKTERTRVCVLLWKLNTRWKQNRSWCRGSLLGLCSVTLLHCIYPHQPQSTYSSVP